jgi:hypothetical protein
MTTSNNPQKNADKAEKAVTSAPGKKDFNAFFAGKTAEKIVKNQDTLEKRANAKEAWLNKPVSKEQAKAFFDKKKAEEANRTPEEKKAAERGFFARKAEQFNVQRESYFNTLKGQDRYAGVSDERLYKVAEMRVAQQRELSKDGIKPMMTADGKKPEFGKAVQMIDNPEFAKKMEVFDKHFADPKNLDKVLESAKAQAEQALETKAAAKTANTQDAGETLER